MIIHKGNIDKWMFDYFEGNLTTHEKIEFQEFLTKNPQYQQEFDVWADSYNLPAEEPYFTPSYEHLKQDKKGVPFYWYGAASVVLLFSLLMLFQYAGTSFYSPRTLSSNHAIFESEDDFIFGTRSTTTLNKNTSSGFNTVNVFNTKTTGVKAQHFLGNLSSEILSLIEIQDVEKISTIEAVRLVSELETEAGKEQRITRFKSQRFNIAKQKLSPGEQTEQDLAKQNKLQEGSRLKNFFDVLSEKEVAVTNYGDPIFIQSDADMLQINPALAGSQNNNRISYNGRLQWHGNEQQQLINRISLDAKLNEKSAYSLQVSATDIANGVIKNTEVAVGYSRFIKLGRNAKFALGAKGNLSQISLNKEKLVGLEVLELNRGLLRNTPNNDFNNTTLIYGGGMGAWLNTKYFHIGTSISSVSSTGLYAGNDISKQFLNQTYIYSVQAGTDFKKSSESKLIISPSVVANFVGDYNELWMASVVRYGVLVGGAGLSTKSSGRLTAGFDSGRYRMMYAVDQTQSLANSKFMISHELNMKLILGKINKNESILQFD
ncbi:MAG: type IX secretion system membrane protein PorP/SprF [Flavobacteriales bacterium]